MEAERWYFYYDASDYLYNKIHHIHADQGLDGINAMPDQIKKMYSDIKV